jgi:hypothetical protein
MDAEAWIALAGGTAGGGAVGTGLTRLFDYLRDRQKQQSDDRHDVTQQANAERSEFTAILIQRLETVEKKVETCQQEHAKCQEERLEDVMKIGHLEGRVDTLTTLMKERADAAPMVGIYSTDGTKLETIGIEPPPGPKE